MTKSSVLKIGFFVIAIVVLIPFITAGIYHFITPNNVKTELSTLCQQTEGFKRIQIIQAKNDGNEYEFYCLYQDSNYNQKLWVQKLRDHFVIENKKILANLFYWPLFF